MPTKAELEKELAVLRAELASVKTKADGAATGGIEGLADSLQSADLETVMRKMSDEIEQTVQTRPLLAVLGALVIGYVAGRTR